MRPGSAIPPLRPTALRLIASLWFCILFALSAANPAQAQSQRSVDVRIAIFGELTITKVADLDFGNIVETGAGTIVLSPDDPANCVTSANIVQTGACQAAEFGGSGETGRIVRIKLPPGDSITLTGPTATMELDNFSLDGSPELDLIQQTSGYSRYRIASASGIFAFRVGGTLNVEAGQAPGVYTGTFDVTIQYN